MNKQRLEAELDHLSALQSWAPELRYFKELNERPVEAKKCDRIINKPTYFMKIDASKNPMKQAQAGPYNFPFMDAQ